MPILPAGWRPDLGTDGWRGMQDSRQLKDAPLLDPGGRRRGGRRRGNRRTAAGCEPSETARRRHERSSQLVSLIPLHGQPGAGANHEEVHKKCYQKGLTMLPPNRIAESREPSSCPPGRVMPRLSGCRSGRPPGSLPSAPLGAPPDPLPTDPAGPRRSPDLSAAPDRAPSPNGRRHSRSPSRADAHACARLTLMSRPQPRCCSESTRPPVRRPRSPPTGASPHRNWLPATSSDCCSGAVDNARRHLHQHRRLQLTRAERRRRRATPTSRATAPDSASWDAPPRRMTATTQARPGTGVPYLLAQRQQSRRQLLRLLRRDRGTTRQTTKNEVRHHAQTWLDSGSADSGTSLRRVREQVTSHLDSIGLYLGNLLYSHHRLGTVDDEAACRKAERQHR